MPIQCGKRVKCPVIYGLVISTLLIVNPESPRYHFIVRIKLLNPLYNHLYTGFSIIIRTSEAVIKRRLAIRKGTRMIPLLQADNTQI